jgi:hypothetical protein
MLALALLCASTSLAETRTTAPGKNAVVYFILQDQKIVVQIFRKTPNDSGYYDLYPERYLVRGDFATFIAVNRGKKRHGLVFLGKKIAPLKPGGKERITRRALLVRGAFPYRSTTDRGKAFKGLFRVL